MRLITNNLSRRSILAGASGLMLSTAMPSYVLALSEDAAIRFIETVVADVHMIINSGKAEDAMLVDFEAIFRDYGEVSLIAKTALGAPGRRASKAQVSAYIDAFQGYISRKYGRQFRKFSGAEIDVVSSRDIGAKGVLVKSHVDRLRKSDFGLEWWVIEVNGRPKLFDLIIEGISMIATERTEIGAMLESFRGDIDKMTAKLEVT